MLLQLKVKNFALIEDIQIDFSSGLNIITDKLVLGNLLSFLHSTYSWAKEMTMLRMLEKEICC
ncbi:MAG: hypothetical protein CM15mP65_08450 [Crocinitomicaceae bacterium]|nr:MAG: hypothetical protein CM15mP65_08450 [Crocinitomicaceae bacterium]